MRTLLAMASKDLLLLWRDRFGLFWVLAFPLLMALFFGAIFSGSSGSRAAMKVVAVDQEHSEASLQFIARLDSSKALIVVTTDIDSARTLVRQGKAVAYVVVAEGFGSLEQMFGGGEAASLRVGIDPSRKAETGYLQGLLMEAWFALVQRQFFNPAKARPRLDTLIASVSGDSSMMPGQRGVLTEFFGSLQTLMAEVDTGVLADSSVGGQTVTMGPTIEVEDVTRQANRPRSSWEITFPQALMWALIGCAAAFAISIVTERTRGTLVRLRLAPLGRGQILAGKGLACFSFSVTVCAALLLFGIAVFGVRVSDPIKLALAVVACAICFVGLMMLISVLGKTEQAVGGAGWAILLVMSMTGGGMVPLMFMPKWLLTLSHISPVKWGILSLEGAIWRSFSYTEMALPLGILTAVGIVAFTVGVVVFRKVHG
jgi:ABC-2 type transport system permease protein